MLSQGFAEFAFSTRKSQLALLEGMWNRYSSRHDRNADTRVGGLHSSIRGW